MPSEATIEIETVRRASAEKVGSYAQILKSTLIMGGSSAVQVLLGIVRTKFVAVLLGPTGVGLMGVYTSITTMVNTLTELGARTSGVRQIAEATATGDEDRVA